MSLQEDFAGLLSYARSLVAPQFAAAIDTDLRELGDLAERGEDAVRAHIARWFSGAYTAPDGTVTSPVTGPGDGPGSTPVATDGAPVTDGTPADGTAPVATDGTPVTDGTPADGTAPVATDGTPVTDGTDAAGGVAALPDSPGTGTAPADPAAGSAAGS